MDKNSKIFVAGASGMVGSAIIRALQAKGYTNIIGSYHSRKPDPSLITDHASIVTYKLDLTDQSAAQSFFSAHKPDHVYLAVAKVGGILANNTYRADFIYQNLQMQNNVIHQSYIAGVKKLLFLGSTCIYPRECPQPMKEEHLLTSPLEYTNEPYATAKIAGMKMCESYNLQYGTNYICAMPTNLYGPGDNFDLEDAHVLPAILRKTHLAKLARQGDVQAIEKDERCFGPVPANVLHDLGIERRSLAPAPLSDTEASGGEDRPARFSRIREKEPFVRIWGSGTPRREFLWSEDMAEACVFLMETVDFPDLTGNMAQVRNTHINIGSGEEISIRDLALAIKDVVGYMGELDFDTTMPDGTPRKLTDVSRLHGLGWRHQTSFRQGIKKFYEWYCSTCAQ